MEYNPVALNEVLAFSYVYSTTGAPGSGTRANRFFVELVNTQTSPELSTTVFNAPTAPTPGNGFLPVLDLGGFVYTPPPAAGAASDPYSGASWDIIFTADDPYSRPDPYRGQLVPYGNIYAATPLSQYTFNPPAAGVSTTYPNHGIAGATPPGTTTDGYNVMLQPLDQQGAIPPPIAASSPQTSASNPALTGVTTPLATDYFYVFGNLGPGASPTAPSPNELGSPAPERQISHWLTRGTPSTPRRHQRTRWRTPIDSPMAQRAPIAAASMVQTIKHRPWTRWQPATVGNRIRSRCIPGRCCRTSRCRPTSTGNPNPSGTTALPPNYSDQAQHDGSARRCRNTSDAAKYAWVGLRRPANQFAPVSLANPMVVVDSVRFPYIDGTGLLTATGPTRPPSACRTVTGTTGHYFPYSGAAVSAVSRRPCGTLRAADRVTALTTSTISTRLIRGTRLHSEQIVVPGYELTAFVDTQGIYFVSTTGRR